MNLGERLRSCREKKGYTQGYVCEKIGLHKGTLSSYESGRREPKFEILIPLADMYEVTVDYLLGRSQNPKLTEKESEEMTQEAEEWLKLYNQLSEENREVFKAAMQGVISKNKTP
ncbi:helix-turn-helix domain-containing protein [Bacillus sp. AFS075034]|uniref:helix-turn-helix domain-containing protein n=1 Tax=Bacillus sp. AFS075034 TaxID=2034281 RepID=UPI000BF400E9|nr:helix-turn-helix transcriptional regulator [Bacillus sp. AFS075034]PFW60804.1 transcriptional regulator [Bacillus sp. AFS075034]